MRQPRAYRYRFYPTSEQAAMLARTFGPARYVYNWALRLRTDAYYERHERVSYADTSAALTTIKREPDTAWLGEVSSVPPQQALRHLDRAFRHFFAGHALPHLPHETWSTSRRVHDLGLPLRCEHAHAHAGEDERAT
jgi:putative transposase